MARISGVDLQDSWRVDYALTRIKGIGWTLSKKILSDVNIPKDKQLKSLTSEEVSKITSKLEEYPLEGELVRQVKENILRLQRVGSYRGLRHQKGLPARGQRTRSNARTKRGKRRTVGAFKKEILTKMTTKEQGGQSPPETK